MTFNANEEFAWSSCDHVSSFQVLWFPPKDKHVGRLLDHCKLLLEYVGGKIWGRERQVDGNVGSAYKKYIVAFFYFLG